MQPLISIIVPTKNRYKYLKYLISLIDSFKVESSILELVIQDNSDSNEEILEYLEKGQFSNVKYYYSSDKLSMSENSDLALLHSKGEYVCFIGDDDGVCRNIVDCVRWMKKNNIDVVKPSKVGYTWGDYNKKKMRDNLSQTIIYSKPNLKFHYSEPIAEIKKVLKFGFQYKFNLPFLYTGIVKRETLDEVYNIGRTYFPGGSPDISIGVCLCFIAKKIAVLNLPVVITGVSKMTGGGILKRKGEVSSLENVGFINKSVIENWEKNIPRIWASRLVWPESGIKALKYMNMHKLLNEMNYDYMFANFSIYHVKYFKLARKFTPNKIRFYYFIILLLVKNTFRVSKNKIVSLFLNRANGYIREDDIVDILHAEQNMMNKLAGYNFEKLIYKH